MIDEVAAEFRVDKSSRISSKIVKFWRAHGSDTFWCPTRLVGEDMLMECHQVSKGACTCRIYARGNSAREFLNAVSREAREKFSIKLLSLPPADKVIINNWLKGRRVILYELGERRRDMLFMFNSFHAKIKSRASAVLSLNKDMVSLGRTDEGEEVFMAGNPNRGIVCIMRVKEDESELTCGKHPERESEVVVFPVIPDKIETRVDVLCKDDESCEKIISYIADHEEASPEIKHMFEEIMKEIPDDAVMREWEYDPLVKLLKIWYEAPL